MGHIIEEAKSGRASCRSCKQAIAKGELRLGEEVQNPFAAGDMTYNWHHLECAARKKGTVLKQALESTDLEIANKDALLKTAEDSAKKEKPANFPYAEKAPTGRASCISCAEKIGKGELRIAVEQEVDTGGFMRKGAGYLHPACACEHTGQEREELLEQIKSNSQNLTEEEFGVLEESLS